MSINLFGSPQIKRGNEPISIQRRKDLALLIYLISASQPQSRDTLAALLWQDQTQKDARSNLRKSLSRLKAALGEEVLVVSQDQAGLNPKFPITLDIAEFNLHMDRFRRHGHVKRGDQPYLCDECQNRLEEAARLYCADFLEGFSLSDSSTFDEWQFFQSEGLRQNLAEALEHLTRHFTFAKNYSTAVEYSRRWLSLDRLHEAPHRQLMLLYALSDQQAAALRQFEECARLLKGEVGVEPEAETLQVYEAIRQKKVHELLGGSKNVKTWAENAQSMEQPFIPPQKPIYNLPVPPTLFVARENELQETVRLLKEPSCRVLTLLGPGGSGKTRLAIQTAASLADEGDELFKDGIWFVSLAPLADAQAIIGAIIEGLQISGVIKGADLRQNLLNHLSGRRMLLVLDNFEHLLGAESIQLISDLSRAAPHVNILITSRERLNVTGEYIFQVEGLEIPAELPPLSTRETDMAIPVTGALQLFEQCARRIEPSFKITDQNYRAVRRICQMVQGMPLAIELAASWLPVLSPEEISGEVERSLDFLESNWRDIPDRQRSLRAVFNSSWALLDKASRSTLKILSVFRASFTREAAQAVAGASVKTLLDLTSKSWIQRLSNGRYQIHELLRQYAFEKLEDEPALFDLVKKRYCEYYANLSFSIWGMMKGTDQARAFVEAENEFENIRTAWMLLLDNDRLELAIESMLPLLFHYSEGRCKVTELMHLVEAGLNALEAAETDSDSKMEIILRTTQGAFHYDGYPLRYTHYEGIFPINMATTERAWSLAQESESFQELGFWGILLAFIYGRLINLEDGLGRLEQLLSHFERTDESWELASVYLHLIRLLTYSKLGVSTHQEALSKYLRRAMEIFTALEDHINAAQTLSQWGELKFQKQDLQGAINQWDAARATLLAIDEWAMRTELLWPISDAYLQLGFFQKSFECTREIANNYLKHGLIQQAVSALSKESYEKVRYGDLSDALHIRRQCLALIEETGIEYQLAWNYWEMGEILRVSGDLEQAESWFERARSIFERFNDEVGKSFYYRGRGDLALARKDYQSARDNFLKSADLVRNARYTWMLIYVLNGLGRCESALKAPDLAGQYFKEALELCARIKDKGITLTVIGGLAEDFASLGRFDRAIELASLVQNHFAAWHETRAQAMSLLASIKGSIPRAKFLQAEKKGRETDLWGTVDRLIKHGAD